nr:MAG TPA: hypothetical protein [Caudoviricetes sp.]
MVSNKLALSIKGAPLLYKYIIWNNFHPLRENYFRRCIYDTRQSR